jgi:RNA polymerase sigma-B factor
MRYGYDGDHAEELLRELATLTPESPQWERMRSELVRMHTPFARHIARRYAGHSESFEDIEQAAMLGLVKAINRYDPEYGNHFLAFASPTMIGEVKRHFRDRTWSLRVPRRLQELRLALHAAQHDFNQKQGRPPTVREIAEVLEVSEEEALEALTAADAYRPVSLDTPVGDEGGADTIGDLIGGDDPAIELALDRQTVRPLLDGLPERERTILLHRFFGNKTQSEIADIVGISQMHVSRLITRSLGQLRTQLLQDA